VTQSGSTTSLPSILKPGKNASSNGGEEVVSKITAKYPDLGNPYTVWLAAYTQSYAD
jgi:hypothetical protein